MGLSHLGCVLAAAWSRLGNTVEAFDFDSERIAELNAGNPPIFEPGLREALEQARHEGRLTFSTDPECVSASTHVFLAYDTPVRDDDTSDLSLLMRSLQTVLPFLMPGSVVIVSSQLPVGTARVFRQIAQDHDKSLDLVYSPENLRLGEAIECYLQPGHIIVGADGADAGRSVVELFAPLAADTVLLDLPSSEMAKHCINTFLATSVTLANQWADISTVTGADYFAVAEAIKLDPRIGSRAYLSPGLGFSGGTLGRDLRVLESVGGDACSAPLFGQIWNYNASRSKIVGKIAEGLLGDLAGRTLGLLGLTYKPGTSTLRRSAALEVACDLSRRGALLRAYDPMADWGTATSPPPVSVCDSAYAAAAGSELVVLLTEWPEFQDLDFGRLRSAMSGCAILDTKGVFRHRAEELEAVGLEVIFLGRPRSKTEGVGG